MKSLLFLFILIQFKEEENLKCLMCHGKKDFGILKNSDFISLYVNYDDIKNSVHSKFICVNCHNDVTVIPHLTKPREIHCLQCHFEGNVVDAPVLKRPEKYKESIHSRAKTEGKKAPDCFDCHGIHNVRPPNDSLSSIFKKNIPTTCGKCHSTQRGDYEASVHWNGIKKGFLSSAVCIDCHREHDILPAEDPRSSLYPKNVLRTCEKCHGNLELMKKAGVSVKNIEAYKESFHGIALEFGVLKAANCVSCHEYHKILPQDDPLSPIHPENLPKTCGKCHPNASHNVAKGRVHLLPWERESGVVFYVYNFFKFFTIFVITALVLHILLDLYGRFRSKRYGE
ncbi:MAG: cytochrome c3 family protein [Candidatus Hydrothermales bacterium]